MSFGGGGAAGSFDPPTYMEKIHSDLMTSGNKSDVPNVHIARSMIETVNNLLGNFRNIAVNAQFSSAANWDVGHWTYDSTNQRMFKSASVNNDPLQQLVLDVEPVIGQTYTVSINILGIKSKVGRVHVKIGDGVAVDFVNSTTSPVTVTHTVVCGLTPSAGLVIVTDASASVSLYINSVYVYTVGTGNIYTGVEAYSPGTNLTVIDDAVAAFNAYINGLSGVSEYNSAATAVNSKATSYFPTAVLTIADYVADAVAAAASAVADAYEDSKISVDALVIAGESKSKTNVASAMTAAVTSIVTNIETLFNDAVANSNTAIAVAITAAVASAVSATEVSVLDDAVDEYEEKLKNSHMRGVNRFLGGMSDINAVNSSAFVFGLALMESDFQHDVAKFRADISMETYKAAFATYMDGFKSTLLTYLSEGVRSLAIFIDAHKANLALYTGTITEMLKAQLQPFIGTLSSHVGAQTQLTTDGARMRMSYSAAGIDSMVKMLTQQRGMKSDYYTRISEAQRIRIDAEVAEDKRNVELDYLEATWDLSLFQVAGGLLASMAGASGYVPNKPDVTVGSVLGGALSGASAGALATGGNPIGVLVGAVLGGGAATSQP